VGRRRLGSNASLILPRSWRAISRGFLVEAWVWDHVVEGLWASVDWEAGSLVVRRFNLGPTLVIEAHGVEVDKAALLKLAPPRLGAGSDSPHRQTVPRLLTLRCPGMRPVYPELESGAIIFVCFTAFCSCALGYVTRAHSLYSRVKSLRNPSETDKPLSMYGLIMSMLSGLPIIRLHDFGSFRV
jgi:hypothetical protein